MINEKENLKILNIENSDRIVTNDPTMNKIIKEVEEENSATLGCLIPAISFERTEEECRTYILLLSYYEEDVRGWDISITRQATYDKLRDLIKSETIDATRSFVISADFIDSNAIGKEDVKCKSNPITVFRFMKAMLDRGLVEDNSDFDIDEWDHRSETGDATIFEI